MSAGKRGARGAGPAALGEEFRAGAEPQRRRGNGDNVRTAVLAEGLQGREPGLLPAQPPVWTLSHRHTAGREIPGPGGPSEGARSWAPVLGQVDTWRSLLHEVQSTLCLPERESRGAAWAPSPRP